MRILLLVLIAVAGCFGPTEPNYEVPSMAQEVEIPSVYQEWWDEVQRDAGIEADLSRLRLFTVPLPWYNRRYGRTVRGIWVPDGRIYLVEHLITREGLVKHELLHELLRGDRAHANPLFDVYDDPLFGLPPSGS